MTNTDFVAGVSVTSLDVMGMDGPTGVVPSERMEDTPIGARLVTFLTTLANPSLLTSYFGSIWVAALLADFVPTE